MLDEIKGDSRLMIFELGDNRIKHRPLRRFLSNMLVEGWKLIELSMGEKVIMKFAKKSKCKRKRKKSSLDGEVKI
jgi:hypothetical protein